MTLKQAYTLWSNTPKNITLATKNRQVVQNVLIKLHGEVDVKDLTEERVRDIFAKSTASWDDRVKAAGILVYILNQCAEKGSCPAPTFDYTIASVKENERPAPPEAAPEKKRVGRPARKTAIPSPTPAPDPGPEPNASAEESPSPAPASAPEKTICDYTDDDLIDEMRRRGWQGDVVITRRVSL